MNINSINNVKFNCLWGKTRKESHSFGENEIHEYYPFKDETQEKINQYVDTYSDSYSTSRDGRFYAVKRSVDVQLPLDFTKQDYLKYIKVQKAISQNNLHEYFID